MCEKDRGERERVCEREIEGGRERECVREIERERVSSAHSAASWILGGGERVCVSERA